jgi:hypothetical protein
MEDRIFKKEMLRFIFIEKKTFAGRNLQEEALKMSLI